MAVLTMTCVSAIASERCRAIWQMWREECGKGARTSASANLNRAGVSSYESRARDAHGTTFGGINRRYPTNGLAGAVVAIAVDGGEDGSVAAGGSGRPAPISPLSNPTLRSFRSSFRDPDAPGASSDHARHQIRHDYAV